MRSTCFSRFLPLGFCFLVLFNGCLAQLVPRQQQQSPRLSGRSECQIDRITAREPNRRQASESGFSEFWDSGENDGLDCAGVEVVRHTINPKGLLLPYYPNTHELVYVVQGRGIQGTVLSGCPETFQTSFPAGGGRDEQLLDKHQRVYRYKEGDILALPAGAVHWTYNDGDTPIVTINLRDTSNVANQLDRNFRKFFLAGNPQSQRPDQGGQRPWGIPPQQEGKPYPGQQPSQRRSQGTGTSQRPWAGTDPSQRPWGTSEGTRPSEQPWGRPSQEQEGFNIFSGFGNEILQEVFNVEYDTVWKLQGQTDDRGLIVYAENFQVNVPEKGRGMSSQQGTRGGRKNSIAQTICATQLSANIASPALADVYNPRGGRISSLNSHKLPVLNLLQLSAETGVLYKNAVLAPHYNLNAHSIIYVTSGNSRIQIVRNDGSSVFDDVVREGQLIVVPQDFAVIKKAGEQGCEWVAFKTNDNAITTQLAGRFSFIRSLPEDVLVNSYDISREEAKNLKYNRQEGVVLSPSRTSYSSSSTMKKKAKNALLNALFG